MHVALLPPLTVSKTELLSQVASSGVDQVPLWSPASGSRFAVPTSYPEDRHLSGMGVPGAVHGPLTLGEFLRAGGAVAVGVEFEPLVRPWVFDRAVSLPAGEGKTSARWSREQLDWEHVFLTRSVLAQHDSALLEPCAEDGRVLQHRDSDRQRLTPYRCQRRCTCPACGRSYGQGKAAELVSLLAAVMAPGRLFRVTPEILAWHLVLSCDARFSAYVDELVSCGEVDQLRRVLRHLTEDVQATVKLVFGEGVAAVIVWHWWHSSNPLSGRGHLHAHVTVPNVSVLAGVPSGVLREQGVLSDDELFTLRHEYALRMARHDWALIAAPDLFDNPLKENAHAKFSTSLDAGRNSIAHRMRYDARHPVVDVLAVTQPEALRDSRGHVDGFYSDGLEGAETAVHRLEDNSEGLAWWARAASIWQGIQTTRYTGWLQNRPRKALGLVREVEPSQDEPEWSTVGTYRLLNTSDAGARIERWTPGVSAASGWVDAHTYEQTWHGDHVQLLPPAAVSSSWAWSDALRPLVVAGPPAAWLAVFAPRPFELPAPSWLDLAWSAEL